MALTQGTMPATALFNALLAVASLHRSGLHVDAVQYKLSALRALSISANTATTDPTEAAQHVAACMLLCAFEVRLW